MKDTGLRFLVRGLTLDLERAHLWGHIVSFSARRSTGRIVNWKFQPGQTVDRSAIDVAEVEPTIELASALLRQSGAAGAHSPARPTFQIPSDDAQFLLGLMRSIVSADDPDWLKLAAASEALLPIR